MMSSMVNNTDLRQQFLEELVGNILPFWMTYVVDRDNGGFYGAVTNDLQVINEIPRSAVLCARILWTYAVAYRKFSSPEYLSTAQWAYDYLTQVFWDHEYGGVYWQVNNKGDPVIDRKHHYAQAYAIYGFVEYHRATKEQNSLELAKTVFQLLEEHAFDAIFGGYIEGSSRDWGSLEDMRLSDKDLNCRKSMNTMLHILESYTNLIRVWDDSLLIGQHKALLEVFMDHIIDPKTDHFKLFFDDQWHSLSDHISYGHDIEGSWLLWEATEKHPDTKLIDRVRQSSIRLASSVLQEGFDEDGSLFFEASPDGIVDEGKEWWVQAEGVVGFYNAFQLSGQNRFASASRNLWSYILDKLIDRKHGDWYKRLSRDGIPDGDRFKAGPWECPYHHSRACLEMLDRLDS